ncbi:hypothetical protein [Edaphobacter dinghuensis]|nr:hypothetical protein [Edaphobacter dinghuensis]
MGLFLSGCGGGSGTGAPVVPAVSPLAGNWLIVGPMPTNVSTPQGVSGFSLAMSFDVTGNNIVAGSFGSGPCAPPSTPPIVNGSFDFVTASNGTIAPDGSFTVQSPDNVPGDSLLIQGKVPQVHGDQFSGNYTASFTSPAPSHFAGEPCTVSYSGMFTATSFPLVSGVYAGTGSTQTITNGVSTVTPIEVQATLQQGGTVTNQVTGISAPSSIALTGSIHVQGFPCFTTGVTNPARSSGVKGNMVVATFTMDDGSTLSLSGPLTDSTEAHISPVSLVVDGGKCGTPPSFVSLRQLDRQS